MRSGRFAAARSSTRSERAALLLREREARGLAWSIWARGLCIAVGVAVTFKASANQAGLITSLGVMGASLCVLAFSARHVLRRRHLLWVGRANALLDCVVLVTMPYVWYWSVGGAEVVPAAYNAKNSLALLIMLFTAINTLALRPLYPALVSGVGVLVLGGYLVQALNDPRTQWTTDNVHHALGPGLKMSFVVWQMLAVGLLGAFLTLLSGWARRTVRDVVALDDENHQMMGSRARAVFEARMEGLTSVVGGIAHELNTPLGVMLSAAATSDRAAEKLGEAMRGGDDDRGERLRKVLADNRALMQDAGGRMQELVRSLQSFTRLDEAEYEAADVTEGLETAVGLVSASRGQGVEVQREYGQASAVRARVRALNQVFLTLIENAYDAMGGGGTLTLRVADMGSQVRVEIADTGPGIPRERVGKLFDLSFESRRGRMGMGLGLPNARRVIEDHGGRIDVLSRQGQGTRFLLWLPAAIDTDTDVAAS